MRRQELVLGGVAFSATRGPDGAPLEATLELHQVQVTVARGRDGVPVVFVDTSQLEGAAGPRVRVRLNDELLYRAAA